MRMTIDHWRITFRHWRMTIKPRRVLELVAVVMIVLGLALQLGDDNSWGIETAIVGCLLFALARLISWLRHGSRHQTPG
jgi:hypothetical protein